MTATPIPRTVAMTVFGDLEVSTSPRGPREGPRPSPTWFPADNAAWMARIWDRVREEIDAGRRAYVVCPRIGGDAGRPGTRDLIDADEPGRKPARRPLEASRRSRAGSPCSRARRYRHRRDARPAAAEERTPRWRPSRRVHPRLVSHHGHRGRRGRARGDRHGRARRRAFRSVPASPAEGQGGAGATTACACSCATSEGTHSATASPRGGHKRRLLARREGSGIAPRRRRARRGPIGRPNSLRLLRVVRDAELLAVARDDARALIDSDPTLASSPALGDAIAMWLAPDEQEYLDRA